MEMATTLRLLKLPKVKTRFAGMHNACLQSDICLQPSSSSAEAYSPGGCSVISSYASGLGSAFGIGLGITVTVCLTPTVRDFRRISFVGEHDSAKGVKLIVECLDGVLNLSGFPTSFDAEVKIKSTLPVARGLKSSSALANATVLAAAGALGLTLDNAQIMKIARTAELNAACSTFGSIDDGYAALLGGVVFADTTSRQLLTRYEIHDDLDVVVMVPPESARHIPAGAREAMKALRSQFMHLHAMAIAGDYFSAMTLSGIIHARRFDYDHSVISEALQNGAEGATLSGKGAAFVALSRGPHTSKVVTAWKKRGHQIVLTKVDNTGSTVCLNV